MSRHRPTGLAARIRCTSQVPDIPARFLPGGPVRLWRRWRASFWFTPTLIVLASMTAAVLLVEVDGWDTGDLAEWSPRLFGAGADGSRAMLSAIATSMITVAGVVFSITIVALSLTSTQYSPRVLRNFMRDGPTQVVLGVFLGIFAYCLVVLRTIRGGDEGGFIPSMAVLGGMGYALAGIAMLIYFIHHVALSIQAASIIARIGDDTRHAIDRLFPQEIGERAQEHATADPLPSTWTGVTAMRSGYVTGIEGDALLAFAADSGRVLRVPVAIGGFVAEGGVLAEVAGDAPLDEDGQQRLRGGVLLGRQRTVQQDAAFGLEQLVDVALRALSPGVNDPSTACMCIDHLGALLARLAGRQMPDGRRAADGQLRLLVPAPDFAAMLDLAFTPVVQQTGGNVQVLRRLLQAVAVIASATDAPGRRETLGRLVRDIRRELRTVRPAGRASEVLREAQALQQQLRHPGSPRPLAP